MTNRFNSNQGYVYDKNGNFTQDAEGRVFVFNGENKQYEIKDANNQVVGRYFYDGEGKRVKKVTATEETVFVYSAGKLVAEYSTVTPPENPTTSYTATDQLLSPRVITDSLGNVISRRDFLPFGEEAISNTGERATSLKYGTAGGIRQKFTGYQKDDENGLDFAEARMYENRHGRFTAVDPLLASGKSANPQTFNRFTYCVNNPLAFTDPTGLQVTSRPGSKVYLSKDGKQVWDQPFYKNQKPYTGDPFYFEAKDGFTYSVSPDGYYSIGKTDFIRSRAEKILPDSQTNDTVQQLSASFDESANNTTSGIFRSLGNIGINTLNFFTQPGGIYGSFLGIPNPAAVTPYTFENRQQAMYGSAVTSGWFVGTVFAGGYLGGGPSSYSVVPETINTFRFSQTTASPTFSNAKDTPILFKNKPIAQLSAEIEAGTVSPSQVPVEFVTRDGVNLIVNTRSSISLTRANVPITRWNLVDRTGQLGSEFDMSQRLLRNNLTNQGTSVCRITFGGGCVRLPQ